MTGSSSVCIIDVVEQVIYWILGASYIGLFIVVFTETALLAGLFLPGNSLLIAAGVVAAMEKLNIFGVIASVVSAGILGCLVGYYIGWRFGPNIFSETNSRFFKPKYVSMANKYFEEYGAKTIVLARFIPFVRTIAPTMAGVSGMNFMVFNTYNVLGAVIWGAGLPLAAYFLGKQAAHLEKYVLFIVGIVLVLSAIPIIRKIHKTRHLKHKDQK